MKKVILIIVLVFVSFPFFSCNQDCNNTFYDDESVLNFCEITYDSLSVASHKINQSLYNLDPSSKKDQKKLDSLTVESKIIDGQLNLMGKLLDLRKIK